MPHNFLVIHRKYNRLVRYIWIQRKSNRFKNTFSISFCTSRGCYILSTYILHLFLHIFRWKFVKFVREKYEEGLGNDSRIYNVKFFM